MPAGVGVGGGLDAVYSAGGATPSVGGVDGVGEGSESAGPSSGSPASSGGVSATLEPGNG